MTREKLSMFDGKLLGPALLEALRKLNPRAQWRNPVMFVVYVGATITTILWFQSLDGTGEAPSGFILSIGTWLWITVLFANFAEALAEGRSKAQAAALRGLKQTVMAKTLTHYKHRAQHLKVPAPELRIDDIVLVEAGDIIPADGTVIDGPVLDRKSVV